MHANAVGPGVRGRRDGSGWPIQTPSEAAPGPGWLRAAVLSRGAVRWYFGASISLIWLLTGATAAVAVASGPLSAALAILLTVVYGVGFLVATPIAWALPTRGRLAVCAGVLLLSFSLFPWIGWDVVATWAYVGVTVGMCVLPWRMTWPLIVGLGVLALLISWAADGWSDHILLLPALIVSISLMMAAFAGTLATITALRGAQAELQVMAAERERGRVARDIHDILGHSLTVIAVKSELAGRLVDADADRAKTEIAEIEQLARGALADVRSTVAGFRGVTVSGELAAARSALEAAGIDYEVPSSTDGVPPEHRELAGWVVREGVTNVLRHSHATRCRIRLGERSIEVADDGSGPAEGMTVSTGLAGLRERVEAAGGRMAVGRSDLGGFRLEVTL